LKVKTFYSPDYKIIPLLNVLRFNEAGQPDCAQR